MKFINAEASQIFSKVENPDLKLNKRTSHTSSDEGIDSEHRKSYSSDETLSETESTSIRVITETPTDLSFQPLTLLATAPKPQLSFSRKNYSTIVKSCLSSDYTEFNDKCAEMARQKNLLETFISNNKNQLDQGDVDSIRKSMNEPEVTSIVASENRVFHYTTRSGFNSYLWYHVKSIQNRFPTTCRDSADWLKQSCITRSMSSNAKAYVLDFTDFFKKVDHSKIIEAIEFYGSKMKNLKCLVEAFKLWQTLSAIDVDGKTYVRKADVNGIPLEHKISIQLMNLTLAYFEHQIKAKLNKTEFSAFSRSYVRCLRYGWISWESKKDSQRSFIELLALMQEVCGFEISYRTESIRPGCTSINFLDVEVVIAPVKSGRTMFFNIHKEATEKYMNEQCEILSFHAELFKLGCMTGITALTFKNVPKEMRTSAVSGLRRYFLKRGYSTEDVNTCLAKGKVMQFGACRKQNNGKFKKAQK